MTNRNFALLPLAVVSACALCGWWYNDRRLAVIHDDIAALLVISDENHALIVSVSERVVGLEALDQKSAGDPP